MGMPTEQQTIRVELPAPPIKESNAVRDISISVIAGLVLAIILAIVNKRKRNG